MPRLFTLAALAFSLCGPTIARADTITISGGALTAVGIFGGTTFTLTGDGFSVAGGGEPGGVGPSLCSPCVSGDHVNFDSQFSGGFTLGSGPATVEGVSYSNVFYTGVLAFDGETVTMPGGSSSVELVSPFVLGSGPDDASFIQGYLTAQREGAPLFSVDLTGRGVATASFRESGSPGLFDFNQVTYSFVAPEPIPEPTTLLLLATGVISVGVRLRGRRKTR